MIAGWRENTNTSCAAPERGCSTVISAIHANQASRTDQDDNNNYDNRMVSIIIMTKITQSENQANMNQNEKVFEVTKSMPFDKNPLKGGRN